VKRRAELDTTAIEAGGARQMDVGSVIGSAFSIFFGHFMSFVGTDPAPRS
jgi:hypothetical protein